VYANEGDDDVYAGSGEDTVYGGASNGEEAIALKLSFRLKVIELTPG